ncbi:hypothetical protein [Arthrobacter sp. TWP1-1]|uniref:hypothetical protein n=1 Tax=Arthrobacter sp. TWP1-1 TaxID=2804568 RepID=UPI003CF152A4
MTSGEKFLDKFMHATDRAQKVFGPADQGDMSAPVEHHHDDLEESGQEQLSHYDEHTDSEGHHYAERKSEA